MEVFQIVGTSADSRLLTYGYHPKPTKSFVQMYNSLFISQYNRSTCYLYLRTTNDVSHPIKPVVKLKLTARPLKMGQICSPETSVSIHITPCNYPGDGRLHFYRGGSLRSRIVDQLCYLTFVLSIHNLIRSAKTFLAPWLLFLSGPHTCAV